MSQGRPTADERGTDEDRVAASEGLLERLHRERLPNGLRQWLVPMERQAMVALRLSIPAGAQHEGPKESGLAHFVEHLVLDRSFDKEIEGLWSDIEDGGGMVNAVTGPEHVVVAIDARREQLRAGLELMHRCLTRADFSDEHVENERRVLLRELHDYGEPRDGLVTLVWKRLLREHPVTRSPAGDAEAVRGLEPARVAEFFGARYRAGGLTLIITGGFDLEEARAEVQATLGGLPRTESPPAVEPPTTSRGPHRFRESRRWEEVLVGYQVGGVLDPDYFALWYIRDHLDDLLYEQIRRDLHVYHLSCELVAGPKYGVLYVWAQLPAADHDRLITNVDDAFNRLLDGPLDPGPWGKLRQRMINRSRRLAETPDELAFHLLGLAHHYAADEPVPDDVLVLAEVAPRDLTEAAHRHFTPERRIEARARQPWFRSRMYTALIGAVSVGLLVGLWEHCHQGETRELRRQLIECQDRNQQCRQDLAECEDAARGAVLSIPYRLVPQPDAGPEATEEVADAGTEETG